jgi:hypothetical protein
LNSHQLSFTGFAAALAAGLPPASNRTATTEVQTRPGKSKSKTACRQHAYSMRPPGLCCLEKRMEYAQWQDAYEI